MISCGTRARLGPIFEARAGPLFSPSFLLKVPPRLGGPPICPDPYTPAYSAYQDATPLSQRYRKERTNFILMKIQTASVRNQSFVHFILPWISLQTRHNLTSLVIPNSATLFCFVDRVWKGWKGIIEKRLLSRGGGGVLV